MFPTFLYFQYVLEEDAQVVKSACSRKHVFAQFGSDDRGQVKQKTPGGPTR